MTRSRPGHTSLSTRGHHNGQVEGLSKCRVREYIVLVLDWAIVASQLEKSNLVINDEQRRVVLVDAVPCKSCKILAFNITEHRTLLRNYLPEPRRAPMKRTGLRT
jgi:hypothetical protein